MNQSASSSSSTPAPSKSSTCYPAVHPVPDPTVQPGFSPVPLSSAGPKDLIQMESSSSEWGQTHQTCSLRVDSSPNDNKPPPTCSSPSPHGDSDAGVRVKLSSDPSLPSPKAAHVTFADKKLSENGHLKVTFLSGTLIPPPPQKKKTTRVFINPRVAPCKFFPSFYDDLSNWKYVILDKLLNNHASKNTPRVILET